MQALARGMSGEAQLLPTLRAWRAALEQKKAYGTIHTLLQTLIVVARCRRNRSRRKRKMQILLKQFSRKACLSATATKTQC
jgi:hypothetical protein